jgi:hypothetical protein
MDRRAFISGLIFRLLAAPLVTEAQPAQKMWRVAIVSGADLQEASARLAGTFSGTSEVRTVDGRPVTS